MRRTALVAVVLMVLVVAPVLSVFGQQTSDRIAYGILEDLAQEKRSERLISGGGLIAGGVVAGVIVAAVVPPPENLWIGGLVAGVGVIPGVITWAIPSDAERAFNDVRNVSPSEQEQKAAFALTRLANKARQRRIMSAIGYTAAGLASLAFPSSLQFVTQYDWLYSTLTTVGMAVYTLLVPSREEQALQTYEQLAGVSG
jgi:MFS family permease